MLLFSLKQGWVETQFKNLSVSGMFSVEKDFITAHFKVCEPSVRAVNSGFNQKVWEDSCVELFLSFDRINYYNFEINCIGSILGAYGPDRQKRSFIDEKLLESIEVKTSLGKIPMGIIDKKTEYTVDIRIPVNVFIFDKDPILENVLGNIYKCADRSPTPHYMYLFEISTEKPDFHRPEFFRKLF